MRNLLLILAVCLVLACQAQAIVPPDPTPTPTPAATPEPSYKTIPTGYPFTIDVPSHWRIKVTSDPDHGTEYRFNDPDSDAPRISVLAIRTHLVLSDDPADLADLLVNEVKYTATVGTFRVTSRTTLPNGAIRLDLSFQERGICSANSISLIQMLPRYTFVAEGAACKNEWEKYEPVLVNAIESFAPKPDYVR